MPPFGKAEEESSGPRENLGKGVQGGLSHSEVQRQVREMKVEVAATVEREIEVLASGLPLHHGAQLAVDITLRSAHTRCGSADDQADRVNGIVASRAPRDKEHWRPMEHTGASVRGNAGSKSGTGRTACSETFRFLGVDTTMVAHVLSVLCQSFRQLARFCKAQMDHRLIWRTCSRSEEQVT